MEPGTVEWNGAPEGGVERNRSRLHQAEFQTATEGGANRRRIGQSTEETAGARPIAPETMFPVELVDIAILGRVLSSICQPGVLYFM